MESTRPEATVPYDLSTRLVVGVASSALFNLQESDQYFVEHGEAAYRRYQDEKLDETLQPGVGFPFIKRLLALNDLGTAADPPVEVIILSKNDPTTGLRVMRSVTAHGLQITRAVFSQGRSPYRYMPALNMSLFLSGNSADVKKAMRAGYPAGYMRPTVIADEESDATLRVGFDFDGVLADDSSEMVYRSSGDLDGYQQHERSHRGDALDPGPLKPLLADLNRIQRLEQERRRNDPQYEPRLRIALITARNAPAHERAIASLRSWGVEVNEAFFLGGIAKSRVLEVMRPHIFFDDQEVHLADLDSIAGVHVPYGIANLPQ